MFEETAEPVWPGLVDRLEVDVGVNGEDRVAGGKRKAALAAVDEPQILAIRLTEIDSDIAGAGLRQAAGAEPVGVRAGTRRARGACGSRSRAAEARDDRA
jgi:hypothetical protein